MMLHIEADRVNFLINDRVEPALYDARRLLSVALVPGVTMEFASPVLTAASNQVDALVAAAKVGRIPDALRIAVDEADGAIAEAVAAVTDANQGGAEDLAREAIGAALAAVNRLIEAAAIEHELIREVA